MDENLAIGGRRYGSGARILTAFMVLAVIVLAGMIVYTLLSPNAAPRNAVEKDLQDAKSAIEANPNNYDSRILLGAAYAQTGDYERAIEQFNVAIKLDKGHAKAYFNIGFTYKEMGRTKEAVVQLKKASKLNRDWTQPYNMLARIYGEQGKYDKAIAETDKVIKLSPMASDVLYLQGTFYEAKKDKKTAIDKYLESFKYDPDLDSPQGKALKRLGNEKKTSK